MILRRLFIIALSLIISSCQAPQASLPAITGQDIEKAEAIELEMEEEILHGELAQALETEGDLQTKGLVLNRIIKELTEKVMPDHLENFNSSHPLLSSKQQAFAEYKGVYGLCHQYRLFYPYKDSRIKGVQWASSILSVPGGASPKTNAGALVAPTLDGFNPLLETGLWLKLCRRGVTNLMPESLYKQEKGRWVKLHFDPTPPYKFVDEYGLYDQSINRYENILNLNLEFLFHFAKLKTSSGTPITLATNRQVDSRKVGFWGSSFGAVVGAMVVAKNKNIKSAVLSAGGGNLPFIIAHSKIALFQETRSAQMQILGLKTQKQYESFISQHISDDPLDFASPTDGSRLFMVLADKDKSVPTSAQYELYQQFGQPEAGKIRRGHVFTLLYTAWIKWGTSRKALNSFMEKLD